MRTRLSVSTGCWLVLLVLATAATHAAAQARLDIFVTPIPNAPFSGTIHVERTMIQRHGPVVSLRTIREIHRDSRGRIYNEARQLLPSESNATPEVISIHLYNPETRISTMLNTREKTFTSSAVNRPPETEPPVFNHASPTASSPQNEFAKEEDLGTREMDGVSVHGIRETQTIPVEKDGDVKQVEVTDEYWYSADLRINMVIKHNDPLTGSVTMTVTGVTRAEPEPAVMEIPEGYQRAGTVQKASQ
jgi:hypothetical protein